MPFDSLGNFQLPHSWSADKARGIGADAARFDQQEADIAAAIQALRARVDAITQSSFNPALYYSRTQVDGLLAGKQVNLGFTPIPVTDIGSRVPPLVNGLIPDQYLPPASQTGGGRVVTINGRAPDGAGNFNISATDVQSALGFTPDSPGSPRTIAQVTGLTAALAGKQPSLGFTPADDGVFQSFKTWTEDELTGKQPALTNPATFSTSSTATTTDLPTGSVVLVNTTGVATVNKRQTFQVYLGVLDSDPYNLANAGPQLAGVWACCGVLSGNIAMFQRIS